MEVPAKANEKKVQKPVFLYADAHAPVDAVHPLLLLDQPGAVFAFGERIDVATSRWLRDQLEQFLLARRWRPVLVELPVVLRALEWRAT